MRKLGFLGGVVEVMNHGRGKQKQEKIDAKWKTEIEWSAQVAEDLVKIKEQASSREGWEGPERQDSVVRKMPTLNVFSKALCLYFHIVL